MPNECRRACPIPAGNCGDLNEWKEGDCDCDRECDLAWPESCNFPSSRTSGDPRYEADDWVRLCKWLPNVNSWPDGKAVELEDRLWAPDR